MVLNKLLLINILVKDCKCLMGGIKFFETNYQGLQYLSLNVEGPIISQIILDNHAFIVAQGNYKNPIFYMIILKIRYIV